MDLLAVTLVLMAVATVGVHGLGSGLDVSGDSRAIIERTVPAIVRGSYIPARSFGNPLYEFIVAGLYSAGGIALCGLYSLLLALASTLVCNALLPRNLGSLHRYCILAALCLNPLFLVNAFSVTEWMQMCFVLLCLLTFSHRWTIGARRSDLAGIGITCALLVLTRPDMAVFSGCLLLALMWERRFEWRSSLALAATFFLAGAMTLAVFGLLNHGLSFLRTGVASSSFHVSYLRRMIIAAVHAYSVFGIVAILIMAWLAAAAYRRLWHRGQEPALSFWMRLFLLIVPVGFAQYVVLPDKLEYIFYVLIVAILMIAGERLRLVWLVLFTLSTTASSLLTLAVFARTQGADDLFFRPTWGVGAVAQDLATMRYNWQLTANPLLLEKIADAVYRDQPVQRPSLHSEHWGVGLVSDSNDLIIGEENYHQLDNPRYGPAYRRSNFSRVYVCDKTVYAIGGTGWRLAEPARQWPSIDRNTGALDLTCHQE